MSGMSIPGDAGSPSAQPLVDPVWLSNRLVAPDQANVSVADHGFTVGDGVFETLAVRGATALALDRHLARLQWCARQMALPEPDAGVLANAVAAVIEAASEDARARGRVRITWTSGVGPLGSARGQGAGTLVVFIAAAPPWPPTARVAVSPWARNERSPIAGVKTTSYADNAVALAWAKDLGADEALLLDTRGYLSEATGSNVLLSVDGRLLTPALSTGCLAGITRALVIEAADVREGEFGEDVIERAQGMAMLSSTRDVHPVSWLRLRDGHIREFLATDPLIARAASALKALYASNANP